MRNLLLKKINSAVILYSRNFDMSIALHHSWLYQPLISEEYKLEFNKATKGQEYHDLDVRKDEFWQENLNKPFPEVTEALEKTIAIWKKEYEKISNNKMTDDLKEFTDSITSALDLVPQMNERRKRNESHTAILESLLTSIGERKLDEFNHVENGLLIGQSLNKEDQILFEELLTQDSKNDQTKSLDKIRLFFIWLFHSDKLKKNEIDSIYSKLETTSQLSEKFKTVIKSVIEARTNKNQTQSSGLLNRFALKSLNLVSKLLRGSKGSKIEGIVSSVLKNNLQIDGFNPVRLYEGEEVPVYELKFKTVIIYCIDSGSYIEYNSINELSKTVQANILYGAGNINSPNKILEEFLSN